MEVFGTVLFDNSLCVVTVRYRLTAKIIWRVFLLLRIRAHSDAHHFSRFLSLSVSFVHPLSPTFFNSSSKQSANKFIMYVKQLKRCPKNFTSSSCLSSHSKQFLNFQDRSISWLITKWMGRVAPTCIVLLWVKYKVHKNCFADKWKKIGIWNLSMKWNTRTSHILQSNFGQCSSSSLLSFDSTLLFKLWN